MHGAACLQLPAQRGARMVASDLFAEASAAAEKLGGTPSEDAVHDFRVAVRRLRTWLRAFKLELSPAVPRRVRRELRAIVRATNRGRDSAVQLDWLHRHRRRFTAAQNTGADWLAERLERDLRDSGRQSVEVPERFRRLAIATTAALARESHHPSGKARQRFGKVLGKRIQRQASRLASRMSEIESPTNVSTTHEARIAAKRLRYLLEPAVDYSERGKALVHQARALQNDLGALHDVHVFWNLEVVAQPRRASADRRAGLRAVRSRLRDEADKLYEAMRDRWTKKKMKKIERDAEQLARRLKE
jgi:CHAD domain-containing protein